LEGVVVDVGGGGGSGGKFECGGVERVLRGRDTCAAAEQRTYCLVGTTLRFLMQPANGRTGGSTIIGWLVSDADREVLERWSKRPKSPMSIAQRSRIVLLAADGLDSKAIASRVGVHEATVGKWRRRYLERGIDGLIDEPRPGAPRKIGDADVEAVVVKTLEETPTDATHWSTRDLAKRLACRRRRSGGSGMRSG
jgi:transposase